MKTACRVRSRKLSISMIIIQQNCVPRPNRRWTNCERHSRSVSALARHQQPMRRSPRRRPIYGLEFEANVSHLLWALCTGLNALHAPDSETAMLTILPLWKIVVQVLVIGFLMIYWTLRPDPLQRPSCNSASRPRRFTG